MAELQIYAVWFNMLRSDDRSRWPADALADPRVEEYWDQERVVGQWFAQHLGFAFGPIAWDAYYLFGPEATWEKEPTPLLDTGSTIISNSQRLRTNLADFIGESQRGGSS